MTTSPCRPSDHNTNVNQTDGSLHVTSGGVSLKTEEQGTGSFDIGSLITELIIEQRITNLHLRSLTENNYTEQDL